MDLLYILIIVAISICLAAMTLGLVARYRYTDETVHTQSRFLIYSTGALALNLIFTLFRFSTGRVEIINTMSMLTCYFVVETEFYLALALNDNDGYEKRNYLTVFNQVVVFLFFVHLYARHVMGFHDIFLTVGDFLNAFRVAHISFFIRSMTMVYLGFYILMMIRIVAKAINEHNAETTAETGQRWYKTRLGFITLLWTIITGMLIVGQFVGSYAYHVVLYSAIILEVPYAVMGFIRFLRNDVEENMKSRSNTKHRMYEVLHEWATSEPFPLQKNLSMDEICELTGVKRDQLSDYI